MTPEASGSFLKKRTKKLLLLLPALGLAVFAPTHYSVAAQKLGYEPAVVQISGTLTTEEHYGPPNYGEYPATDMKVWALILVLDTPVDVIVTGHSGPDQDSFFGVKRIQITGIPSLQLTNFVGQHIILGGTLFEKENGNHYTNFLMLVQTISSTARMAL